MVKICAAGAGIVPIHWVGKILEGLTAAQSNVTWGSHGPRAWWAWVHGFVGHLGRTVFWGLGRPIQHSLAAYKERESNGGMCLRANGFIKFVLGTLWEMGLNLGQEDSLEENIAQNCSCLENPMDGWAGRLQSMGWQEVGGNTTECPSLRPWWLGCLFFPQNSVPELLFFSKTLQTFDCKKESWNKFHQ